jgi:hypothetical protein
MSDKKQHNHAQQHYRAEAALGAASEIVKRGTDALGNPQAQTIANYAHQACAHHGAGKTAASLTGAAMAGIAHAHAAPAVAAVATAAVPIVLVGLVGWGLYKLFDD